MLIWTIRTYENLGQKSPRNLLLQVLPTSSGARTTSKRALFQWHCESSFRSFLEHVNRDGLAMKRKTVWIYHNLQSSVWACIILGLGNSVLLMKAKTTSPIPTDHPPSVQTNYTRGHCSVTFDSEAYPFCVKIFWPIYKRSCHDGSF